MNWIVLLLIILASACSSPRDTPLPKDISKMESIKPAIEKLSPEERDLVAGHLMRHSVGSALSSAFGVKTDPIPDGMTLGKAIDEQRNFLEKQTAEEAVKKAEREKAEAARKALAD